MPEYTYLDFEREADDNQPVGSALVTRFPEGWAGNRVNNSAAAMASAIRTLGDQTLFAPLGSDLNPTSQNADDMALQNSANVNISGGIIGARGSVPIQTVIFYGGTFDTYTANYTTLFNQGWVICDGRVVTNPFTGATVTLPNFIGRYPFCASTDALTTAGLSTQGTSSNGSHAHAEATGVAGAHNHNGATLGAVLSTAEMPDSVLTDISIGGSGGAVGAGTQSITKTRAGTNTAHAHGIISTDGHQHTISADGTHAHTVLVQPPSIYLIPLMRVW